MAKATPALLLILLIWYYFYFSIFQIFKFLYFFFLRDKGLIDLLLKYLYFIIFAHFVIILNDLKIDFLFLQIFYVEIRWIWIVIIFFSSWQLTYLKQDNWITVTNNLVAWCNLCNGASCTHPRYLLVDWESKWFSVWLLVIHRSTTRLLDWYLNSPVQLILMNVTIVLSYSAKMFNSNIK